MAGSLDSPFFATVACAVFVASTDPPWGIWLTASVVFVRSCTSPAAPGLKEPMKVTRTPPAALIGVGGALVQLPFTQYSTS